MSDRPKRSEGKPMDRLTRLCDAMTSALKADPEYREGDNAIIMINDGKRGGIVLHGYDDNAQAMEAMLIHVRAVFESDGKILTLMPFNARGQG